MQQLLTISPPPERKKPDHPLLAHGFRPFYLLAALYGAFFLNAWLVVLLGAAPSPVSYPPVIWHGHEMLFGFVLAAVCGFLLTAMSTWSQAPPVTGRRLGVLVGLWVAGRLAMWFADLLHPLTVALLDLALIPALGIAVLPVVLAPGNRKHMTIYIVLALLFAANLMVHLERLAGIGWAAEAGLLLGVDVIVVLLVVVIGRLVPTFCAVARIGEGGGKPPIHPALEALAIGSALIVLAADLVDPESFWTGIAALAAAAAQLPRIARWRPGRLIREPHIWGFHLGYAWLIAGFAFKGVAALDGPIPAISALHAFTAGGMGTTILVVMATVGLLHTGRPLPIRPIVQAAILLATAAAFVRTAAPILFYEQYKEALIAAGALWGLAFVIYAVVYWPILSRPRPDGIPG